MPKKILLVDDDPGLHVVMVPILSKAGYTVTSAKSGRPPSFFGAQTSPRRLSCATERLVFHNLLRDASQCATCDQRSK